MHCVFSVLGGTVMGPNCTVNDCSPLPASSAVTSPSTGPASALGPPLLLAPLLPPLPEAPLLLLPPLPPPLLPLPPPFPGVLDELHAANRTAHVSARREDRIGRLPPRAGAYVAHRASHVTRATPYRGTYPDPPASRRAGILYPRCPWDSKIWRNDSPTWGASG